MHFAARHRSHHARPPSHWKAPTRQWPKAATWSCGTPLLSAVRLPSFSCTVLFRVCEATRCRLRNAQEGAQGTETTVSARRGLPWALLAVAVACNATCCACLQAVSPVCALSALVTCNVCRAHVSRAIRISEKEQAASNRRLFAAFLRLLEEPCAPIDC